MVQKKYMDIERMKEKYAETFEKGEMVTITEKVDGANAALGYDKATGEVAVFSRRNRLTPENTLQGFYDWAMAGFTPNDMASITDNGRYILFGEWLVKHSVKYPDTAYRKFYMFDVWDTEKECYLQWNDVTEYYTQLRAACKSETAPELVPVFYIGEWQDWDHALSFRGQTKLNAEPCGEGVVVKSQDRLQDKPNSHRPVYLKLVDPRFAEVHDSTPKQVDPEKLKKVEEDKAFVAQYVTERRVEKMLQKLVEDGVIPENWSNESMGVIAKNLPRLVYDDVKKEEPEVLDKVDNFGKISGSLAMGYVRKELERR